MACVELPPANADSEMEEGEIVDEVDELSDISSEEEFLLRQRLQVLENYNNVLERKQAKRTSNGPSKGEISRKEKVVLCDLSEVSETDFEDNNIHISQRFIKKIEPTKPYKRKKQTKEPGTVLRKIKDCKKKPKQDKKKSTTKIHIKSSDDSDDEYLNKRLKLANAVTLKKSKNDTSSLKERINRMLFGAKKPSNIIELKKPKPFIPTLDMNRISDVTIVKDNHRKVNIESAIDMKRSKINNSKYFKINSDNRKSDEYKANEENVSIQPEVIQSNESINLCTDNDSSQDGVDSALNEKLINNTKVINENKSDASSDEDLELLREYALKTKCAKSKIEPPKENVVTITESKPIASEDEDSDTAELRLICLKSTLLKKAIEIKQKQKLKKRLSQSSFLQDDLMLQDVISAQSENNTDIESVDMDIGSDGEEKTKENSNNLKLESKLTDNFSKDLNAIHQDNELEEDEDLLRAKLLTSLSKNLPNLVDLNVFTSPNEEIKSVKKDTVAKPPVPVPEEKKFIIKLGESDSEGEHEATKNLTKMHIKLSEHFQDFQSKLDTLLKSTRMEFEKESDGVQKPTLQKLKGKFVPKAMNHLPKSEQVEYRNLVKRMAELEKIKLARNSLMSSQNKMVKETLKLRNTSLNTLKSASDVEEKFALSRKKIAEESAKVLKLKDEAKKLSQKYKIVATELKNISTAINLNKRQQRAVHNNLQQIRLQHQLLLKGSTCNLNAINASNRKPLLYKIQKENNPTVEDTTYTNLLKSVKVSVVNDVDISAAAPRLSVQLDVANNKKTIKLPKNPVKGRVVDLVPGPEKSEGQIDISHSVVENGDMCNEESLKNVHVNVTADGNTNINSDDYKSPLAALGNTNWKEDPNAFLCPYEVGGSCRDPDCKYLHPKIPSHQ